jgi:hypothetical protein
MTMNAKRTLMTSLFALAAATLAGCGGSPGPSAESPQSQPGGYDDATSGYGAPAPEAASEEGAAFDSAAPAAPPPAPEARARTSQDPFELTPGDQPQSRPGLATQWGERRFSRVTTAPFVRADRSSPFAVEKLFYNDPQGIAAMSDTLGGVREHTRRFPVGGGHLELALRDESGRFLTGFVAGSGNFVTGVSGQRYTIFLKNHSPGRVEAVVSVDGLDVIDGKAASLSKRGYLLDPHGDLEIDGFRTSNSEVAAFRFGSVRDSYAAKKHGETRNVGVIGLALFHERGDSPRFWGTPVSGDEARRRTGADPFPQQFASPP